MEFDIDALCDVAAAAGDEPSRIVTVEKIKGGFRKALLMIKENGKEVIAKIPCRIAGPTRLTTASEVGVIEYGMSPFSAGFASYSREPTSAEKHKYTRSTCPFMVVGQRKSCRCGIHYNGEGCRGSAVSAMD